MRLGHIIIFNAFFFLLQMRTTLQSPRIERACLAMDFLGDSRRRPRERNRTPGPRESTTRRHAREPEVGPLARRAM